MSRHSCRFPCKPLNNSFPSVSASAETLPRKGISAHWDTYQLLAGIEPFFFFFFPCNFSLSHFSHFHTLPFMVQIHKSILPWPAFPWNYLSRGSGTESHHLASMCVVFLAPRSVCSICGRCSDRNLPLGFGGRGHPLRCGWVGFVSPVHSTVPFPPCTPSSLQQRARPVGIPADDLVPSKEWTVSRAKQWSAIKFPDIKTPVPLF